MMAAPDGEKGHVPRMPLLPRRFSMFQVRKMLRLAVSLLLAGSALSCLAARHLSVEQLEQLVAGAHGKSDANVAQLLSEVELTERLSAAKHLHLESDLPGPESRQSLMVLADISAFLAPPGTEIPATVRPDIVAQKQMLARTVQYAENTVSRLPNFVATRETLRFQNVPQGHYGGTSLVPYQPLQAVGRSTETTFYSNGREVVNSKTANGKTSESTAQGLSTRGVFGPILGTVLVDLAQGGMGWNHWEQGPTGPEAVFRYVIPREKSHYQVEFCCIPGDNGKRVFQEFSGYHGVIAVDPANGAVLRLTLQADLKPSDPIHRSDLLVEYGPVEIGGKTYICPERSVSILISPPLSPQGLVLAGDRGLFTDKDSQTDMENLQIWLNDVVFSQYHVFRADTRLVAGDDVGPAGNPPAPLPETAASQGPANSGNLDSTTVPEKPSPAEKPAKPGVSLSTGATPVAGPPPSLPTRPVAPGLPASEITVAPAAELPDTTSPTSPDVPFSLRVNARLVDIGVVASDKRGHPVTDLRSEDFEIDDNGRKQAVRFFTRTTDVPTQGSADVVAGSSSQPQPAYSNRRAAMITGSAASSTQSNTTVLLIDSSNLANSDLANTRRQMLSFLQDLPANEYVALYVLRARGFQVLQEQTVDHALLAAKLTRWSPSAGDTVRSQEQEGRNRQQMDTVQSAADLQSVNGNMANGPDTAATVDPQLRDEGNNSGRDALLMLTNVARHLGAIPGHKSLVWVTSDNVLVEWTDKAVSSDKGSKRIDGLVLSAQEALNEAHVSVYPLDASQLETMAIDPGLKNANVEVSPGTMTGPQAQGGGAPPGRITAEMQQDLRSIQKPIHELAEATGGRTIPRTSDLTAAVNAIVEDGRATYLLSFAPDQPADGQYHRLIVRLASRKGISLRYRTGYLSTKEPAALKDRVRQALSQPLDMNEIGMSANPVETPLGATIKLKIATNDLSLTQQDQRWVGKLDIFLVQREDADSHARVSGQVIALKLLPATYREAVISGVPFDQLVEREQKTGSIRVVIVDETSGRIGSVTVPATAMQGKWH
jgi:VWFA-related protein